MTEAAADLSRVALYARYSSPLQSPTSITDQLRECRRHVAGLGGNVIAEYTDAKKSGSSTISRKGFQSLMDECGRGAFTAICTEGLDRLSRDLPDISRLHRQLEFLRIPIITVQDGPATLLLVGLKGTMNAIFLKELSVKTRRGLVGVIESGRQVGPPAYGYRLANRLEGARVIRGLREIDPPTSAIVQRIYRLYVDGHSARAIARILHEENIAPPRNAVEWHHSRLTGVHRSTGILSSPLYKGHVYFGLTESDINPETGKRVTRPRPRDSWITVQAPHLRIIDDDTWDLAQERLRQRSRPRTLTKGVPALAGGAMPLTPLLRCARCQGPVRTIARHRWACQTARKGPDCPERTFVLRDIDRVCAHQLIDWIQRRKNWHRVIEQAQHQILQDRALVALELSDRTLRVQRLITAVETDTDTEEVRARIRALGQEIQDLKTRLAFYAEEPGIVQPTKAIRPVLLAQARQIQSAIDSDDNDTRLPATVRLAELLDHIDMSPGPAFGKASLHIRPNTLSLIHSALRDLGEP